MKKPQLTMPDVPPAQISPRIKNDTMVSEVSRFASDVWDFSNEFPVGNRTNAEFRINWSRKTSDGFDLLHPSLATFHCTLRELVFARTIGDVPGRGKLLPKSALVEAKTLRRFFAWLVTKGCLSIDAIQQQHLDAYLLYLKGSQGVGPRSLVTHVNSIQQMSIYSDYLTWPLKFVPWRGRSSISVAGARWSSTNSTEIIPDDVFEPLYKHALSIAHPDRADALIKAWKYFTERGNSSEPDLERDLNIQAYELRTISELHAATNELFAACFVVIAALSGMRDSEIKTLKVGCARVELGEDQSVRFYKVSGSTIKDRRSLDNVGGLERTWVVIKPVVDAIEILTRIRVNDRRAAGEQLFYRLRSTQDTNRHLRTLMRSVPDGDAGRWNLTTAQFRRTLARWIVRRPFGIIAGKIQFGHVKVATTQGYAAYDKPWVREIQSEQAQFTVDVLDEISHDIVDGALGGPLANELLEFRGQAGDRRADEIAFMLKNGSALGRSLHVGTFNYCFFNPEKALCRKPDTVRDGPILSFCRPEHCANSCITRRHLPIWEAQVDDAKAVLVKKGVSPNQREVLIRDIKSINRMIEPIRSAGRDGTDG